jgi:hypothetical protein
VAGVGDRDSSEEEMSSDEAEEDGNGHDADDLSKFLALTQFLPDLFPIQSYPNTLLIARVMQNDERLPLRAFYL